MSSENFNAVGPGKALAYIRGDLRLASQSLFLVGPWLDDYVAGELVLVASRCLTARVLVRSARQVDAAVWERILAGLSVFKNHWSQFQARTLERLHAKCLCIDEKIAYVGSTNWYKYSVEDSLEMLVRGPLGAIEGLQAELEELWEQSEPLAVATSPASAAQSSPAGITQEVIDPLAAQVLKANPKAFVLGKKKH